MQLEGVSEKSSHKNLHVLDSVYESMRFQRYQGEEIFPSHFASLMRKRQFSFLPCERVEIESTKRRQDGEVGIFDTVVWRNSHKTMPRLNESNKVV